MKTTFTRDFLVNELDLPYSSKEDKVIGSSRWSIQHSIIFEHEGKNYRTYYQVGATESQDEGPWEYQDSVECEEVHEVERMIKVWEAK